MDYDDVNLSNAIREAVHRAFEEWHAKHSTVLPRFLSITDAAKAFGVSRRTLHSWISTGRLPGYAPGDAAKGARGKLLLSVQEIEEYIRRPQVTDASKVDEIVEELLREIVT